MKITSEHIKKLFDEKFWDNQKHLIAFEVNEGTGGASGRRADAVSLELWPSNDYKIVGYEFKVSRADWLSEMKQPEKSQAISCYCDEWYLVAPKGVLGIDELPKTWGYIQVSEKRLTTKIPAPARSSEPVSRPFMASLLRNSINKYGDADLLQKRIDAAREEIKKEVEYSFKFKVERLEERLAERKALLEEFKSVSGVEISRWNFKHLKPVIEGLKNVTTRESYISSIENQLGFLSSLVTSQEEALNAIKNYSCQHSEEKEEK